MTVTVADVIAVLDAAYPRRLAETWDSVGLVAGDPTESVTKILVTVDVTGAVVQEALGSGVQLLVAHHPLLLRGVDTVGAHTAKGKLIHQLIRGGCALFTAHTNADAAYPGVSDALAAVCGIEVTGPLASSAVAHLDKWVVMVPEGDVDAVQDAMFAAGCGQIGNYSECSWRTTGIGQFRPGAAAKPAIGSVGSIEEVDEVRLEMVAPQHFRAGIVAAMRSAHPYEEPAFDVFELASIPGSQGIGRIGTLRHPTTLRELTARVAAALPTTETGARFAGDSESLITRVAVCGGSGDSFLDDATSAGVDAFITADLRHHRVDEHLRDGGPAVIDVAHWASEFPWCAQAAELIESKLGGAVTCAVSQIRTDPWTGRCDSVASLTTHPEDAREG